MGGWPAAACVARTLPSRILQQVSMHSNVSRGVRDLSRYPLAEVARLRFIARLRNADDFRFGFGRAKGPDGSPPGPRQTFGSAPGGGVPFPSRMYPARRSSYSSAES